MKNADQSAFPVADTINPMTGERCDPLNGGLSKREYFAAMAMQGLVLSNPSQIDTTHIELVAQQAVQYSDALLSELSNPSEEEKR